MANNDSLDILKFVLALMVVAIHASLFPSVLHPWLRCAVPLFFVISSFFFFLKYFDKSRERKSVCVTFSLRLLRMYAGWFLLLLPVTLYAHRADWFGGGLIDGVGAFLWSMLCSSTFLASWFYMALLISVMIVVILLRIFPLWVILIIGATIHLLTSMYWSCPNVIGSNEMLNYLAAMSYRICFIRAMPWVAVGMLLAWLRSSGIWKTARLNFSVIVALFVGVLVLFCESQLVRGMGYGYKNVLYVSLPFVVVPLFLFFESLQLKCENARKLRLFSIVAYPLHYSVIVCAMGIFKKCGYADAYGVSLFLIGVSSSYIAYRLICLCKEKDIKVVRWLY